MGSDMQASHFLAFAPCEEPALLAASKIFFERYRSAESGIQSDRRLPGPSSVQTSRAACDPAPELEPPRSPVRQHRFTMANASSSVT